MKLSKEQLDLLKQSDQRPIVYEGLSQSERDSLSYLSELGYVSIEMALDPHQSNNGVVSLGSTPASASITEKGKAFLATDMEDNLRFQKTNRLATIALILSGIAIIVSIIALFAN